MQSADTIVHSYNRKAERERSRTGFSWPILAARHVVRNNDEDTRGVFERDGEAFAHWKVDTRGRVRVKLM